MASVPDVFCVLRECLPLYSLVENVKVDCAVRGDPQKGYFGPLLLAPCRGPSRAPRRPAPSGGPMPTGPSSAPSWA